METSVNLSLLFYLPFCTFFLVRLFCLVLEKFHLNNRFFRSGIFIWLTAMPLTKSTVCTLGKVKILFVWWQIKMLFQLEIFVHFSMRLTDFSRQKIITVYLVYITNLNESFIALLNISWIILWENMRPLFMNSITNLKIEMSPMMNVSFWTEIEMSEMTKNKTVDKKKRGKRKDEFSTLFLLRCFDEFTKPEILLFWFFTFSFLECLSVSIRSTAAQDETRCARNNAFGTENLWWQACGYDKVWTKSRWNEFCKR